jgi:hypothetical protein
MASSEPSRTSNKSLPHRFRIAGVVLIVVGFVIAGGIYWLGIKSQSGSDLPAIDDSKQLSYRVELNVGKVGLLMNDAQDALKNPGTQALLIIILSAIGAAVCFYIARVEERKNVRR